MQKFENWENYLIDGENVPEKWLENHTERT